MQIGHTQVVSANIVNETRFNICMTAAIRRCRAFSQR